MNEAKLIENIVEQMAISMGSKVIRERLHRCVDESCDQLNLDAVDFQHDQAEAVRRRDESNQNDRG